VSQENVEIVRRGFEHFLAEGDFMEEVTPPGFVWDMTAFHGWPEQQVYEGLDESRRFIREWSEPFEDWQIELEALHDAGEDRVLAIVRQHGRSKSTGLPVDMVFGQLFTVRDGMQTRMQMYSDPDEALRSVGLQE
jgi:ketosteroid isomerase-like protein